MPTTVAEPLATSSLATLGGSGSDPAAATSPPALERRTVTAFWPEGWRRRNAVVAEAVVDGGTVVAWRILEPSSKPRPSLHSSPVVVADAVVVIVAAADVVAEGRQPDWRRSSVEAFVGGAAAVVEIDGIVVAAAVAVVSGP